MKREIKFRAWDKNNKILCAVDRIDWSNEDPAIFLIGNNKNGTAENYSGWIHCKGDYELMQFTGLHDKNGKEIYEGDILQSYIHPEIELLHKIEWSEKFNGWFAKNLNNKGKDYKTGDIQLWVYIQHNLFEVVGNVFEGANERS